MALSTRQFDPALAHLGVVATSTLPILQAQDELMRVGVLGCLDDLLEARLRPTIGDVVADRAMQQRRILRHYRDRAPQAFLRHAADVLAVDGDAAAFDIMEAQQDIG